MSEETKTEEQESSEGTADEAKAKLEAFMSGETEEQSTEETTEQETTEETSEQETQEEEAEQSEETNTEKEDNRESAEEEKSAESEKTDTDDNSAFARMRRAEKRAKELERQIAEATKKPEVPATTDTVDTTVDRLVKVWGSGDGDESAHLAGIRKASSKELTAIYQKAVSGVYGEHTDDVISMIQREMPMIQAREKEQGDQAQARRDQIVKAFEVEKQEALADFPDYADGESDASKAMAEFTKNMLGSIDEKTGEIDGAGSLPDELSAFIHSHPYVHHQLADAVFKASRTNSDAAQSEVAVLKKEVESLKGRLAKYEDLSSPTHKKGDEAAESGSAAETKQKLKARMGVSD